MGEMLDQISIYIYRKRREEKIRAEFGSFTEVAFPLTCLFVMSTCSQIECTMESPPEMSELRDLVSQTEFLNKDPLEELLAENA